MRCKRPATADLVLRAGWIAALPVCLMLVTGCGGGGTSAKPAAAPATQAAATAASARATSATVTAHHLSGYGTVLATGAGRVLYMLTSDPTGGSRCTGSCTSQWWPLTAAGRPNAGAGVSSSLLSSFRRSDGSMQVSYGGHALYTYAGANPTAGVGIASDGGVWYLISPAGKAVKSINSGY